MTEAAADSSEDPSEEMEDLEPLEPDNRGKKVGPTPAFLPPSPAPRPGHQLFGGGSQPWSQFLLLHGGQGGLAQSRGRWS